MRCILDTNIIVSGLASRNSQSPPARLLDAALENRLPLLGSFSWKVEMEAVLLRPHLLSLYQKRPEEVIKLIDKLYANALLSFAHASQAAPDPNDTFLWALLEHHPDAILITGDKKLLTSEDFPGRVIAPAAFLEAWPELFISK